MSCRRLSMLLILLAILMLKTEQGRGDTWQNTVSTQLSTEYDTNPLMSPTYSSGVWRYLFDPSYTLTGILGEDELKAGIALQIARSSNETLSQYRNSPSLFLDWLRHINDGEFGVSSRYAETATRIAEIGTTSLGSADSIRALRAISGRWSKALSERSILSADGSYEGVTYQGGTYINYSSRSANMMFNYAWSEHSIPFIRMSYADYEPASGGPSSRLDSAVVGLNWKTSDYLEYTFQIGNYNIRDTNTGTQGAIVARYTGQRTSLLFNIDRHVSPSGLGGFSIVDQANGSWSFALSERSKIGTDLGWQKNHLVTDIIYRSAGAWLQHELNSNWGMRTFYLHNILSVAGYDGASSNVLGIALVYSHSDF